MVVPAAAENPRARAARRAAKPSEGALVRPAAAARPPGREPRGKKGGAGGAARPDGGDTGAASPQPSKPAPPPQGRAQTGKGAATPGANRAGVARRRNAAAGRRRGSGGGPPPPASGGRAARPIGKAASRGTGSPAQRCRNGSRSPGHPRPARNVPGRGEPGPRTGPHTEKAPSIPRRGNGGGWANERSERPRDPQPSHAGRGHQATHTPKRAPPGCGAAAPQSPAQRGTPPQRRGARSAPSLYLI